MYYIATSSKYQLPSDTCFTSEKVLREHYSWVDDLVVTPVNKHDYLLSKVPEEFRSTLSYMAYERGHSAGEHEKILLVLERLVNDLKPAIDKFAARNHI